MSWFMNFLLISCFVKVLLAAEIFSYLARISPPHATKKAEFPNSGNPAVLWKTRGFLSLSHNRFSFIRIVKALDIIVQNSCHIVIFGNRIFRELNRPFVTSISGVPSQKIYHKVRGVDGHIFGNRKKFRHLFDKICPGFPVARASWGIFFNCRKIFHSVQHVITTIWE